MQYTFNTTDEMSRVVHGQCFRRRDVACVPFVAIYNLPITRRAWHASLTRFSWSFILHGVCELSDIPNSLGWTKGSVSHAGSFWLVATPHQRLPNNRLDFLSCEPVPDHTCLVSSNGIHGRDDDTTTGNLNICLPRISSDDQRFLILPELLSCFTWRTFGKPIVIHSAAWSEPKFTLHITHHLLFFLLLIPTYLLKRWGSYC